MAFDEGLARRIQEVLAAERGVSEKRVFGGIAFLINGIMAVATARNRPRFIRRRDSGSKS